MASVTTSEQPLEQPLEPAWRRVLGPILCCPKCRTPLEMARGPSCASCGFEGRVMGEGRWDLVDETRLSDHHQEEITAQTSSADIYYENEDKLTCHWDRISADDLPGLLGGHSGRVLDLGCGTGTAGAALRRAGNVVVGADLTPACLEHAQHRLDAVVRADAAALPFLDATFDVVVARGALHHLGDVEASLAECKRILKPGGVGLFIDPRHFSWLEPIKDALRKDDPGFAHDHHAFDVSDYADLVGRYFDVEEVETMFPLAILFVAASDLIPLPRFLPREATAKLAYRVDRRLNRTPLASLGHLIVVRARRP